MAKLCVSVDSLCDSLFGLILTGAVMCQGCAHVWGGEREGGGGGGGGGYLLRVFWSWVAKACDIYYWLCFRSATHV